MKRLLRACARVTTFVSAAVALWIFVDGAGTRAGTASSRVATAPAGESSPTKARSAASLTRNGRQAIAVPEFANQPFATRLPQRVPAAAAPPSGHENAQRRDAGAENRSPGSPGERSSAPIPFDQIGAAAAKQYSGDGLAIVRTGEGAQLRSVFQKLVAEATPDGLWIASTDEGGGRLHLVARTVRRGDVEVALDATGLIEVEGNTVRYKRPGIVEEYSTSVDGVRQDFVIAERLEGAGALEVDLSLTGARAEPAATGVTLALDGSGRALAYSRLRVIDAVDRELTATLETGAAGGLVVRVEDEGAAYPVRIDPTFSDADWVSLNPGTPGANQEVRAIVSDGSGNVYIGGDFTIVGTVAASRVAKWDGSTWSALGAGMNFTVYALAVSGSDLYAGGSFTTAGGASANNIAKWDGSTWSALGAGMTNRVQALAVSGSDLYAGGDFSTAGGVSAIRIAKWDGSTWSALGAGMNGPVRAVAVSGSDLYAGGEFTTAGGVSANQIAKWDGSAWSALGAGMNNTVQALAVSGSDLYAGGFFATAGGVSANGIAKWDGSTWSAVGTGTNLPVLALAVNGSDLYAGGFFTTAGGVSANGIAKWDGSAWSALGTGMNGSVIALAVSGSTLYAGGGFTTAGAASANQIAKWDGSTWSALALGGGMNGEVFALAVNGSDLYAGGFFTTAGGVSANGIAKWDGSAWSALGTGTNLPVFALAVSGSNLYAGGDFTTAGGASATRIAKWDGSTWSALGTGINGRVQALTVSGSNLYAGGDFTTAGGVSANRIAKWNGSAWSALGAGMNNTVFALAVNGSDLYAGGVFTTAGGVGANSIAKWNGSAWSALGAGMNSLVIALAVSGSDLYAGGFFTTAGGVRANFIAKWDGSAWSALGTGMNIGVRALATNGSDLYAGSDFTTAGGVSANRIAKWNGSAWSALGSGLDKVVRALATDTAGHLFLGGDFGVAGTTVSPYIAQANLPASAKAGADQTVAATSAAGAQVTLNGAGSSGLSFTWRDEHGTIVATTLATTTTVDFGPHTFTLTAHDGHGGQDSDSVNVTVYDNFTITITGPANGSGYMFGESYMAVYSCGDSAGVLASCAGPVPSGSAFDTSFTGAHQFAVTATNTRGDSKTVTHTYTVTAQSTTTVTCPAGPVPYTGSPLTPCTVSVTAPDGLNLTPAPVYANNTNAGTATASYTYTGDADHIRSADSENFTIAPATTTTTVTCPDTPQTYTGSPLTPCSVLVTGGGLSLTPAPSYTDNIDPGQATASYTYGGDANHAASSGEAHFTIVPAITVVRVSAGDPAWAAFTPQGTAAEISARNSRSGLGSIELVGGITTNPVFGGYWSSGIGTLGQLSALSFDWFIDPSSEAALPTGIFLRVYEFGDPRSFLLTWNGCTPNCALYPIGSWQTSDVLAQLRIMPADGNPPPALLADVDPNAPITGVSVNGGFSANRGWSGFADNITIGFAGQTPTRFNFEVSDPNAMRPRPTITWNTPAAIPVGTALSATQLNATADVPGTFVYSPAAGTSFQADPRVLGVTFIPSDGAQYLPASKIVVQTVTGSHVIRPGAAQWTFWQPQGASSAITGASPRAGNGSLELTKGSASQGATPPGAFYYPFFQGNPDHSVPGFGTIGQLSGLSFDWFIDPTSSSALPPEIAVRVYDSGDPRSFFLYWDTCSPNTPCTAHPTGSWQSTTLDITHLRIQPDGGNPAPASLDLVDPNAPIKELQVRSSYGFGQPWHGFVDNVAISLGGAAPIVYNFEGNLTPQATLTLAGAPATAIYATSFTVETSGGSGSGAVTFTVSGACSNTAGGASITMTSGTGTCAITATKAGDATYLQATSNLVSVSAETATQAALTVTGVFGTAAYGTSFSASTTGGSGTGAVTFSVTGACSNTAGGALITMASGTGTCAITATKSADPNYSEATSNTVSVTATKAAQASLTVTGAPSTAVFGTSFTVSANGGSGSGALTFAVTGVCSNTSGGPQISMTSGTGSCTVAVTKAGDDNYDPATSPSVSVTADKAGQATLTVSGAPSSAPQGSTFPVGATGGSGTGAITFAASGACSNTSGGALITMTASSGTCSITATKNADANYLATTSAPVSVTATPRVAPTAPTNLAAVANSSTQITLTWTDTSTNENGFAIERSQGNPNSFVQIATTGANSSSSAGYVDSSGLTGATKYYYRVRAFNAGGNSPYSNSANATTLTPPAAPAGLSATAGSSSRINLTWTNKANNATGFKVSRSLDGTTYSVIATVGLITAFADTNGLAASTMYFYRVQALNGNGDSAYSNTASAMTFSSGPTAPTAPSSLTAAYMTGLQILLTWTDNSDNETGFVIERSIDGGTTFTGIAQPGANAVSYTDTGASPMTTYVYRVKAYNGVGSSSYSNQASAKTKNR